MKKTLQKELRTTSSGKGSEAHQNGDEHFVFLNDLDNPNSSSSSQQHRKTSLEFVGPNPSTTFLSSFTPTSPGLNYPLKAVATGDIDDTLSKIVDLEYLKHVIFKFLTSREYEVNGKRSVYQNK